MNLNDELSILRGIPLFSGIKPEALKLLAFASDRMIYQAGQNLFREGDQAGSAFIILSGTASIRHEVEGGQETVGVVAAHTVVGEVALFCDKPRQVTVTANSSLEALLITKDSFQKLMSSCPCSLSNILSELGEQMNQAN